MHLQGKQDYIVRKAHILYYQIQHQMELLHEYLYCVQQNLKLQYLEFLYKHGYNDRI